ncbi:hypothetical protein OXPF_28660 [Oxobacter pfennigii]|uniref:Glycosyl transferase family 2 n=1 Tax=Oxobacter pfennigii TaxID=36849 RepID=A0A0P9ADX9_9CLOT|nr:glycosyltransferase family A protein [Oxobacter pfennigii]KPU43425.1 hypothetical protein OXPF_28660 [Oxobacter pfennigii]
MEKTRVLIASPICQDPIILKEYLLSMLNIDTSDLETEFLFIDDNTMQISKELLKKFKADRCVTDIIDAENRQEYIRTDMTHKWNNVLIEKVAHYRNIILSAAREKNYDFLFMVDSDLLLHPDTLKHLISLNKDIISEIFWTKWAPGGMEYPQVWLYDHNTLHEIERGKFLSESEIKSRTNKFMNKLKIPGVYKVGGLGACTLISQKVLRSTISYDNLPNISFQGEDRHFCIRAAALGFELYVDTHYPAYHIYRRKNLDNVEKFKVKCGYSIMNI